MDPLTLKRTTPPEKRAGDEIPGNRAKKTKVVEEEEEEEAPMYKFRAEGQVDVDKFGKKLGLRLPIETEKIFRGPDVRGTFASWIPIETLRLIAFCIPDCHVICETLMPIDEYTGERDWELPNSIFSSFSK